MTERPPAISPKSRVICRASMLRFERVHVPVASNYEILAAPDDPAQSLLVKPEASRFHPECWRSITTISLFLI